MEFFNKWSHLPWKNLMNPMDQWKVLPTFLIGEYLFFFLSIVAFIHACRQGRLHMLIWITSFITGSANDIFFMYLPLVDNFWQAQATVMLSPRLPLYICCVYNVFMYYSTVTVWRLGLPRGSEACLTGLMAEFIYGVYDIIGAKYLWWTWHDTDPPIRARILGAPIGSSLWIVTFTGTYAFVLRTIKLDRNWPNIICVIVSALVTTPLMMVQMALLQLVSADVQGEPTHRSLMTGVTLYIIVVLAQFPCRSVLRHPASHFIRRSCDKIINLSLIIYYWVAMGIMWFGKPENHISTGIHQTTGQCYVEQRDFSGQIRYKYLCPTDYDEDWDFRCTRRPSGQREWYTICGRSHKDFSFWMTVFATASLTAMFSYTYILRFGRKQEIAEDSKKTD